jgi:hypothetical protein
MHGGDMGGGVTSPSSSSSSEESNSVGVSSPRSFTARWAALRALFLSFRTRIFLLWAQFASHFTASLDKLMPHDALLAPPRLCTRS